MEVDVNVNDTTFDGRDFTGAFWAASFGHTEVIRILAATGMVDWKKGDSTGLTPLHMALFNGRDEVADDCHQDDGDCLGQDDDPVPQGGPGNQGRERSLTGGDCKVGRKKLKEMSIFMNFCFNFKEIGLSEVCDLLGDAKNARIGQLEMEKSHHVARIGQLEA